MKRKHSLGYLLLAFLTVAILMKIVSGSLFVHAPDRIQFVVYGQDTKLYSLGRNGDINYYVGYSPDLKVEVPNGYGSYRIGALSKLIAYEKKPELLSKAFSVATSSFVTYYFYPTKAEIYYADDVPQTYRAPSFTELMLYKSNARFLDRVYLYLQILKTSPSSFQNLDIGLLTKKVQQSLYLSSDAFGEEYKGFFYNRTYRAERHSVQIKYANNYDTAVAIGKILEGNGIRVVDVSEERTNQKNCSIVTETAVGSRTVEDLRNLFHCDLKKAPVDTSDILFILGPSEKEWEL